MALEAVEMRRPQPAVRLQPPVQRRERRGPDAVDAMLRSPPRGDETRLPQHLQVLGDGRLADGERLHELVDAAVAAAQLGEDAPAGRLGEGGERVHALIFSPRHIPVKACSGCEGRLVRVEITIARAQWDPEPGWLNTASYGLPPRRAFEALQAHLGDWRVGRTSWEGWDEATHRS